MSALKLYPITSTELSFTSIRFHPLTFRYLSVWHPCYILPLSVFFRFVFANFRQFCSSIRGTGLLLFDALQLVRLPLAIGYIPAVNNHSNKIIEFTITSPFHYYWKKKCVEHIDFIFYVLTLNMEFISQVRSTIDNINKWKRFHIQCRNISFSVYYIFLGFWHVSFKFWMLHAIHDVKS